MFNISSHKKSAHQNYTEILSHSSQDNYHKENNKYWRGCREETIVTTVGNTDLYSHNGNKYGDSKK